MIEITVQRPGAEPETYRFDVPRIRIGRDAENELVLDSPSCSRCHAEIRREERTYRIVDLGSTNGLVHRGARVTDLVLGHGDELEIGEHKLAIALPPPPSLAAPTVALSAPAGGPGGPSGAPAGPPLFLSIHRRGRETALKLGFGVEYVLGRAPSADLLVDDTRASARHALVGSGPGGFYLRDLGSTNGTLLNGEPATVAPLSAGDEITIGDTVIAVREERKAAEDEALIVAKTRHGLVIPRVTPDGPTTPEAAAPPPSRRLVTILAGVAALLVVAVVGWRWTVSHRPAPAVDDATTAAAPLVVPVRAVRQGHLVHDVVGSASVRPQEVVTVSAEVAARIVELPIEEGTWVESGALLARQNDRDLRLQLEEARSSIHREQVDLAREDYERKQRLHAQDVVSRADLDRAHDRFLQLDAAYRSAQARVHQLDEHLEKARIVAPIAGFVSDRPVNAGEFVAAGTPVAVLEDMSEVLVELPVSDRDVVKIAVGRPVEATSDAFPGRTLTGTVDRIGSAADPVTRTFTVEARIGNPDLALRSGMIVTVRIALEGDEEGLLLPAAAVREREGEEAVVLVVRDGVARRIAIRVGRQIDRELELLGGLDEGDLVVVRGQREIDDGQPVQIYVQEE